MRRTIPGLEAPEPALRGSETKLDREQFREVFASHGEAVHRLLWRLSGSPHDAEDLTQETFVTFWRKRDQYRGDGSLGAYLRRIAFRTYLNSRQRLSAKRPPVSLDRSRIEPSTDGGVEEIAEKDERSFLLSRVREALRTVPDRAREAFVLFRFEGLTVAEVSATMAAPVKTTESRLRKATELLAARLRKHRNLF
jgi:RNA polymerase sigma-70 factor (ECF subfamily)